MQLIDRYLQAVRFWLPRKQQDDIIAELSEDIRSQIEDRESALGRKLNEAELAGILKQLGRPVGVANRYLPQHHLVGPVLFPIYLFVLKIVTVCYLLPWALVFFGMKLFNPAYRAAHSGEVLFGIFGPAWGSFWTSAFVLIGMVTIIFAILERTNANNKIMENWDPRKLPAVSDPKQIPRSTSVVELVAGFVFIIWWLNALGFQTAFDFSGTKITLAPVWLDILSCLLLLALVNIALSGANLVRPGWTPFRAGCRLATDVIGSVMCCWFCKAALLAEIIVPNVPAGKTLAVTNAINTALSRAFPAAIILCAVIAFVDIRWILRLRRTGTLPAQICHSRA